MAGALVCVVARSSDPRSFRRGSGRSLPPSRASTLAGLPPTWFGVGTVDLFHDECVDFASRLRTSGVPCTLEIAQGAYHGFDKVSPAAAVSRRFTASWESALREALAVT
jgi:acetyl esterase/lipase